jgi:hypothetical protein
MGNPEKLATLDEENQNKNTAQYVLDTMNQEFLVVKLKSSPQSFIVDLINCYR